MKRLFAASLAFVCALAVAQVSLPTQRLRGTIKSFDGTTLVLAERGGETLNLAVADKFAVNEVYAIDVAAIKPGSYIGAASMPQPDGTLKALEVLVFPEAARGSSEGHSQWDLMPGSTMTNATVAELGAAPMGRTLQLNYPNGTKTVMVPDGVPIVTLKPGDTTLLVPGAKVVVFAQQRDGKATAVRALAGRDGFAPPM